MTNDELKNVLIQLAIEMEKNGELNKEELQIIENKLKGKNSQ